MRLSAAATQAGVDRVAAHLPAQVATQFGLAVLASSHTARFFEQIVRILKVQFSELVVAPSHAL